MSDREKMSFGVGDFGIVSTQEIDVETFLNSDPEDIEFIKPEVKTKSQTKKVEDKLEEEVEEAPKEKKKIKEIEAPNKEVSSDDIFSAMEKKIKQTEESEEEESEEEDDKVSEEEEEDSNVYASVAKELLSNGIFTLDEEEEESAFDEITTPEQLLERFQYQSRKNLAQLMDQFLSRYGEDYEDMFKNVFINGVKPEDYLSRYTKIQSVKSLNLEDESNQERVVRELYKSEGRSSEYIEKKITQLKNYNDLHEESVEAQRILVEREEQFIQEDARKKEADIERRTQIRNEYITSVNRILGEKLKAKEFDGIPIDRKVAEQTFAYITEQRFQTPDKKLLTTFDKDIMDLERPENHETKVKLAILFQMLKEDPKLTKLATKAVSKETNTLFRDLKRNSIKNTPKQKEGKETIKKWDFTDNP